MKRWMHSDDMGATLHSTERMLASWQAGVLDGFSVLSNGLACGVLSSVLAADAARPARISGHLNLSEGPSLAPIGRVPLLVDAGGQLRHTFGSLVLGWITTGPALVHQVELEWRAQISALREHVAPRPIASLDGHMHVHMLPFLFPVAARLAEEFGIPAIRVSIEPWFVAAPGDLLSPWFAVNAIKHFVLRACSWIAVPVACRHRLSWPMLLGVLYSGRMTAAVARAGLAAARRAHATEVEVVFHVGRAAPAERERWKGRDFMADFYLSPWRDLEYDEAHRLVSA